MTQLYIIGPSRYTELPTSVLSSSPNSSGPHLVNVAFPAPLVADLHQSLAHRHLQVRKLEFLFPPLRHALRQGQALDAATTTPTHTASVRKPQYQLYPGSLQPRSLHRRRHGGSRSRRWRRRGSSSRSWITSRRSTTRDVGVLSLIRSSTRRIFWRFPSIPVRLELRVVS